MDFIVIIAKEKIFGGDLCKLDLQIIFLFSKKEICSKLGATVFSGFYGMYLT